MGSHHSFVELHLKAIRSQSTASAHDLYLGNVEKGNLRTHFDKHIVLFWTSGTMVCSEVVMITILLQIQIAFNPI